MSDLYDSDFYSWTQAQAEHLRRRSGDALDWERLAEEVRLLGVSEERELESRYVVLLTHLLTWIVQPERRGRSWRNTIDNQRAMLAKHLRRNPGLKRIEVETFADAYALARREASTETDLDLDRFPEAPPFTVDQAKDAGWWPSD